MAHTNGTTHDVAAALDRALIIPNECNANIPPENVVDGLLAIAGTGRSRQGYKS